MNALLFLLAGLVGMGLHGVKVYLRGQISCSVADYFFRRNMRATLQAMVGFVAAYFGFLSTSPELSMQSAYGAFMLGYGVNSLLNSD